MRHLPILFFMALSLLFLETLLIVTEGERLIMQKKRSREAPQVRQAPRRLPNRRGKREPGAKINRKI